MSSPAELRVVATIDALAQVLRWVDEWCAENRVDPTTAHDVRLAAEEVCTNVIVHGYSGAGRGPMRLRLWNDGGEIGLEVEDEAPPFDPLSAAPPDLSSSWEQRPLGGLGWHLVRQVMDELRHETLDPRGNRVTMFKRNPSAGPATEEEKSHGSTR